MEPRVDYHLPVSTESPSAHECEYTRLLEVNVIYTDVPGTLAALRKAGSLASNLRARIRLIVPQVVPYPLPLSKPGICREVSERRFHTLAGGVHIDTHVQICLCRDRAQLVAEVLPPRSLVVIGGRNRWWPTAAQSLASKLRRSGHEVIFTGEQRTEHA